MLRIKIILFFLLLSLFAIAQPDGPNDPTTAGTDASVGSFAWSNTGNILSSDNSRARVDLDNAGDISNYITATGFGFAIPVGATIDGIVVDIERSDNGGGGNIKDNIVKIIKGGVITGTDKSAGTTWPSSDTYKAYGSAIDLWGTAWTVANINASNFGVAISAKRTGGGGNNRARIDHIQITVYYTVALPVELLSFSAKQSGTLIELNWTTASEINNDCFEVQRSNDGLYFSEIAKMKGNGNSSTYHSYSLLDYEPLNGANYYRLVQIDFDGQKEILPVIFYNFAQEDFEITLNVFDALGNMVYSTKTTFSQRIKVIKTIQLRTGVYIIQSIEDSGNQVIFEKVQLNSGQ